MSSAVEAHVLARLAAARVRGEPFEHCIVDQVFPADFFEAIIDHWPEEDSWRPLSESGRVSPGACSARQVVLINPEGLARLAPDEQAFWARMGEWLLGPALRSGASAPRSTSRSTLRSAAPAGHTTISAASAG